MVLLAGCFSDPPESAPGGTEGSTSTGGSTGLAPTTAPVTTVATTDPQTTSSALAESSSTGDDAADSTSTGDPQASSSSGPDSVCQPGEVQVGSLCLAPLTVSDVLTVTEPNSVQPSGGDPCVRAECIDGRPLGGGFVLEGLRAFASHRDMDMTSWTTCAGPDPEGEGDGWQGFAQCAVSEGDIFVTSESYELDGDEGASCFDLDCPGGTTLVGGGGRWGPDFVLQGSGPTENGERWQVCGSGAMVPTTIEIDAYCAVLPPERTTQVFEESAPVGPGTEGCVQVACPGGLALAGGGFVGITATQVASHPVPGMQGWNACSRVDGNFNVDVRARVLCLD